MSLQNFFLESFTIYGIYSWWSFFIIRPTYQSIFGIGENLISDLLFNYQKLYQDILSLSLSLSLYIYIYIYICLYNYFSFYFFQGATDHNNLQFRWQFFFVRVNYTCHPCDLFYNASTYLVNHFLLILMEFGDVTIANITYKEWIERKKIILPS